MPKVRNSPHPTKGGTGGLPPVTPVQVDRVRRSVLDVVRSNLPDVREVLAGSKKWDNQQVRLFTVMLNKVMPDLHHSFNEHSVENKQVHELTVDELMEIAKQGQEASEAEDVEFEEVSNESNTTASGETPTHDSESTG
jgi:hypothetical protein